MAYERQGESPIDYQQCRYGHSKLLFRGPRRNTKNKFMAFVGGTETYGKYVPDAYPQILEARRSMPCANFGAVNGGVDAFVNDESIMSLCARSEATVIQVMGAQNMSNRFYSVHPRRNDRFLKASTLLQTIYREVDFSEISFTRHLLSTLKTLSPEKFKTVEQELKSAWLGRMEAMLSKIGGRVILLWISDRKPDDNPDQLGLGLDPLFVDGEMIEKLRTCVSGYVEVQISPEIAEAGRDGMLYPQLEAAAAHEMYGPGVHRHIANELEKVLF